MGFQAVPRYAEYEGVRRFELLMVVAKILTFGGAAGRGCSGVEVDDRAFPAEAGKRNESRVRSWKREFRGGVTGGQAGHEVSP